jgi:phenylalanyl-tRNA synthetase beta chain
MKISVNTIKHSSLGCSDDVTAIGIDALVAKIGAQLGGVDEVVNLGEKYQGIVVAKVVRCQKHPNADRLNVCAVDDGGITPDVKRDEQGYVQVVCGAPNVREGLTVAWLPPGATVPDTVGKDPFVLEARELRGVVSNGMLASPKELALGDSHAGLLEIEADIAPGTDFAEAFGLKDDVLIDIENKMFTHRPDCFGYLGVARELAGIQGMPFVSPQWYREPTLPTVDEGADQLPLEVSFENVTSKDVPRFMTVVLRDVAIKPSPVWLQVELAKVGVKSINNIVDYTNWFMLLTGQPLHAYDYDKVKALSGETPKLVVRYPHEGEQITLLNGKTITPRSEAIMIATDKQLIGVGGVMGGTETEVDDSTNHIILECANFDMYSIRRTAMAHGLFTEAVTRFNKGQSAWQNPAVIARVIDEIKTHADGIQASGVIDIVDCDDITVGPSDHWNNTPVKVTPAFINQRLGLDLGADEIIRLLQNVEFGSDVSGDEITFYVPFWRTDIELPEDLVEEVGRLYGFDKLPVVLPQRDLTPTTQDPLLTLKASLRNKLANSGANEILTYSFVHGDLLAKAGQDPVQSYALGNALSPDLQYYRQSLTPSLLEKVHPNNKAGYDQFALFEIGKTHILGKETDGLPTEFERLALVFAANKKAAAAYHGAAFYEAKRYVMSVLASLGLDTQARFASIDPDNDLPAVAYYEPGRAATIYIGEHVVGRVGEYKASVRKAFKLPDFVAGFELGLTPLLHLQCAKAYVTLPRFPSVSQDITLQVSADTSYQQVFDLVQYELQIAQPTGGGRASLQPIDIYQDEADTTHTRYTFRVTIANYERTLTDKEVTIVLHAIATAAREQLGATLM